MNNFTAIVNKKVVLSIMQLLNEEGLKETAHKLERESGLYFDMKYFEGMVLAGKWDDAETYLSGFTKIDDNYQSMEIYFELRKQKYIEALDNNDRAKALDILMKDLKVRKYPKVTEDLKITLLYHEVRYKELTQLLTLNNIGEYPPLSTYEDAKAWRRVVMNYIKQLIVENPKLVEKLKFPSIDSQTLRNNLQIVLKRW